jgi:hypothetical protein
MPTFQSLRDLIRGLQQGEKLLNDMFQKRKTVAVNYEEALETLGGDENRLTRLIKYGVIEQTGDSLELSDVYLRFFEEVLSANEIINIAFVKTYIDKLNLDISSYLVEENKARKEKIAREIRYTFKRIENTTRNNVKDLKHKVDDTYKQEPNFKIKELRLKDFDEKAKHIGELIHQTELLIDKQSIFFANMDIGMRQTISEVKDGLRDSAHGLIAITAQIIDYLNRIEYQSRLVKKVRQLKYLKDQFMIEEGTDIKKMLADINALWMERQPKYITRVSLDFLRNDDAALEILNNIRARFSKKANIKSRLAPGIEKRYLEEQPETSRMFDHQAIINGFLAQGNDLFRYIWLYKFEQETDEESRLVLFLQLASQYNEYLRYTSDSRLSGNIEYPIIYPK